MRRMGALPAYALLSLAAIALAGALFSLGYRDGTARQAILVSAAVAFVVQMGAFAVALPWARGGQAIAGWGIGAMISMGALVVYGFVVRATGMPASPALLSLATFLFVTELIEPPLLTR